MARGRKDSGRGKEERSSFTLWVKKVTKSSALKAEGRGGRGGRGGEEGREHGKQVPGVGG